MPIVSRVVILLLLSAGAAAAQERSPALNAYTGEWLLSGYHAYREKGDAAPGLAYTAYVSGMVDMLILSQRVTLGRPLICPPLGLPMKDYLDTVGRYLEEQGTDLRQHRAYHVLTALKRHYGCQAVARSGRP